jgi:SnoaL-like protein
MVAVAGVADSVVVAVDSMLAAPDVAAAAAEAVVAPAAAVASRSASSLAVVSEAAACRGAPAVCADLHRALAGAPAPSASKDFAAGDRPSRSGILPADRVAIAGTPAIPATGAQVGDKTNMDDRTVRLALERHWNASDANDFDVEHEIYREDAVLNYPQSGERIHGRRNIQESRFVQPNKKRFTVRRIVGSGDLWVTEFILSYDGVPSYAVSIMEFRDGQVASETQYFADPFDPAPSRAHLVERAGT